jgi:hypothetical protein
LVQKIYEDKYILDESYAGCEFMASKSPAKHKFVVSKYIAEHESLDVKIHC